MADPKPGMRATALRDREGDDAQLVSRMAAGDERALASLYDIHGAVVFGLAVTITRNQASAEAVVADAFAALWRDARSFDPARQSAFGWLSSTVRALALAVRRSSVVAVESTVASILDDSPVGQALARLSAPQRTSVELAYFRGLSRAEIAAFLGESEVAVGMYLRTAMESLRHVLHPEAQPATAASTPRLVAGL